MARSFLEPRRGNLRVQSCSRRQYLKLLTYCSLAVVSLGYTPSELSASAQNPPAKAHTVAAVDSSLIIQQKPVQRLGAIAFSPDGSRFATASGAEVQIWDRQSGDVLRNLKAAGAVSALAWSPDGSRLAAGGLTIETGYWRGMIFVWNTGSGQLQSDWRTGYADIRALAWSPDGRTLAAAGGGDFEGRDIKTAARLWTSDGKLLHTLQNYYADSAVLAVSPDGRKIALSFTSDMGGQSGTGIYDMATGRAIAPLLPRSTVAPGFAPDGTLRSGAGLVKLDLPLPELPKNESISRVVTSPDKNWLITTGYGPSDSEAAPAFRLWRRDQSVRQWKLVRRVEFNRHFPIGLDASSNAVALRTMGGVIYWKFGSDALPTFLPGDHRESNIALSPDASFLAASFLWDLTSPQPRRGEWLSGNGAIAFAPDGSRLIEASGLVATRTGQRTEMKITQDYEYELRGLRSAAFSADGQIVATIDDTVSSSQCHLWDGVTGEFLRRVRVLPAHRVGAVEFAPQGRLLAVAGVARRNIGEGVNTGERAARSQWEPFLGLIDSSNDKIVRRFSFDADDPYGIADMKFSPDGKTMATSGTVFRSYSAPLPKEEQRLIRANRLKTPERTLRFWDVTKGTLRSALPLPTNWPMPLAFINNDVCAVVTPDGTEFWNISETKLLARFIILAVNQKEEKPVIEWLITTPGGAFDASAGAGPYLRWDISGVMQMAPPPTAVRIPGLLKKVLIDGGSIND